MISLFVFLGNYGVKYSGNRHNAAWLFADSLKSCAGLNWQKKFKGQFSSKTVGTTSGADRQVYFLKPETYMNLSGDSIGEAARFYKIKPEEILVLHDELELSAGVMSLKWSGGLGGHNGLRSTKAVLGTADFWRLRFGIGRPSHDDISGWVLSDFTSDERIKLEQVFIQGNELFELLLTIEPEKLLEKWKKVSAP